MFPLACTDSVSRVLQAVNRGDHTAALSNLDKLQAQLDEWRAAISSSAASTDESPAAEVVPQPPEDVTPFSVNRTYATPMPLP
jgi:hypothetical protein